MIKAADYATPQLAINAAQEEAARRGGCDLWLRQGDNPTWETPTVTAHRVWVYGDRGGSIIRVMNPMCHGLHFKYPTLQAYGTGGGVFDVQFEAGPGWSQGFAGDGSEGAAVLVTRANDNFYMERIGAANFGTAVGLLGCWNTNLSSFYFLFCKWSGILIDVDPDGAQGGGNKIRHGKISNNGYAGTSEMQPAGLDIRASGGDMPDDIDITSFYNAVRLRPNVLGKQVLDIEFTKIHGDTAISDAWLADGSIGDVFSHGMTACRGAFSGGCGLRTRGDRVRSIRWNGGALRENHQHGLWREGGALVSVRGAEIDTNGVGSPDVYSGAHTGDGLDTELRFNTIGNGLASTLPASQKYAIQGYSTGLAYPHIGSNAFVNNLSGDTHL